MRHHEQEALVLDVRDAREADKLVVLLVDSGELVATIAPSAARSRKRFSGALLPGARVRARWSVRREGSMARLEETTLLGAPPAPDPIERYYTACHLIEIVRAFAREGAEDPRLYRLLARGLEALERGQPVDTVARYVELWVLRLAGLLPELGYCGHCGGDLTGVELFIAPGRGVFCSQHVPAASYRIDAGTARWLQRCRRVPFEKLDVLSPRSAESLARPLLGMIVDFSERPLQVWPALSRMRGPASA